MATTAFAPALPVFRGIAQRWVAPGSLPAYRLAAIMFGAIALLVPALGFTVDSEVFTLVGGTLAFAIVSAMAVRSVGGGRLATAVEAAALVLIATMLTCCLTTLLAVTAFPYRDGALVLADRAISPAFSWLDMFSVFRGHAGIVTALERIYTSLLWQPFALVAALAITGREAIAWRFLHAWMLSLFACIVVFVFVPAVGTYPHFQLSPSDLPGLGTRISWRQQEVLEAIRSGALRTLTPAQMTGIVAFPSFHAAAATLIAWAVRRMPVIGPAFIAWNVVMALSAPLIGGHYFIDILAGIAIAIVMIGVSGAPRQPMPSWASALTTLSRAFTRSK